MVNSAQPLKHCYPAASKGKVVVWGYLASYPFGGMTWQVLHYLSSLRQCGFDVWYVEDTDAEVRDPFTHWGNDNYLPNVKFLKQKMESIGLANRWIFRPPGQSKLCLGAADINGLSDLYKNAELVINLCGSHELQPQHDEIKHLVYVETDPVPNQVAIAEGKSEKIEEISRYKSLFTYGENLDADECKIPKTQFKWNTTRPPVVLDWWESSQVSAQGFFNTVTSWNFSHNDIVCNGEKWRWSKHHEFRRIVNLPEMVNARLQLAISGLDNQDTLTGMNRSEAQQFRMAGWSLIPTVDLSEPASYRRYIQRSRGEITVAKEQYVLSNSGWFSDRSVCYLASARPVVTQETGFSKYIPCGEGLFSFKTQSEAAAALDAIESNPLRHSNAAREIAHDYFDGKKQVQAMMSVVGLI